MQVPNEEVAAACCYLPISVWKMSFTTGRQPDVNLLIINADFWTEIYGQARGLSVYKTANCQLNKQAVQKTHQLDFSSSTLI